jgi:hypothetical protein
MDSGQMYFYRNAKMSLSDIISHLTKLYQLENVKQVLVHLDCLDSEITVNNVKITPKKGILPNHFWFISDNNSEKRPESRNFIKIT